MLTIFISYYRESEAIVRTLAEEIKALGHKVWFDQELSGGQIWWDQILKKIRACDLFVFAVSPEAMDSKACGCESDYAVALGKPILPVQVAEGVSTSLLKPAVLRIQIIDYRQQDRNATIRLARALNAVSSPEPLPDPLPNPPEAPISHLGKLLQKIKTAITLSKEEQSVLVVDIKRSLQNPKTTDDARMLLEKLRGRGDLFANIADEIDDLLKNTELGDKEILKQLRERMLAANTAWKLRKILYEIEYYLAKYPHSTEARLLKDQAEAAMFRQEEIDRLAGLKKMKRPAGAPKLRMRPIWRLAFIGFFIAIIPTGFWFFDHLQNGKQKPIGSMVIIQADNFLYGTNKVEKIIYYDFSIDIYPVTNSQYKKFIEGEGYSNDAYWSEEGIKWRQDNGITSPEFWTDEKWNQPEHPVVGVSYYEAEAYAKWAGKRLPTEIEWERAARGTDGRKHPWGDEFNTKNCNTEESCIGKTTLVTKYPKGISLAGCYDMAGNVWEWTTSFYHEAEGILSVRGGSWNDTQDDAQCTSRIGYFADFRSVTLGFRCVRID